MGRTHAPVHYRPPSRRTHLPARDPAPRSLASALTPPPLPAHAVVRGRLLHLIDSGRVGSLTLLRAPAGTGKSVALGQWMASGRAPRQLVFVGLDRDADSDWMLTLIAEGLVRKHVVRRDLLRTRRSGRRATNVAELGAALAAAPERTVLVLDCDADLPHDASADLHDLLATAGGGLRLVTATRAEPLLPLHVYRLNDDLVEIGARDLAFSAQEARELVSRAQTGLPREVVDAMTVRTQGWATGLLMMAATLAGANDPPAEARRLDGASGDIADYLATEVLDRLPRPTRELLMRGSVVDFLRPGLTEVLVGENAARSLAILSHDSVFVEAMAVVGWYRYHPFLRELLRNRLTATLPREAARLRSVSTHWLVEHHHVDEAIRNAVAMEAWDLAARTVIDEYAIGELLTRDGAGSIGEVFAPLPVSASGTAALIVRAIVALNHHEMSTCATLLRRAEDRLDPATEPWPAAALTLSVVRALHSAASGTSGRTLLSAARRVRTQLNSNVKASAHRELALLVEDVAADAFFLEGAFADAARTCTDALAHAVSGYEAQQVSCLARLAFLAAWSGHCRRAMKLAEQARSVARAAELSSGFDIVRELALALVCTDTGELREALRHSAAAGEAAAGAPQGRCGRLGLRPHRRDRCHRASSRAPHSGRPADRRRGRRRVTTQRSWVADLVAPPVDRGGGARRAGRRPAAVGVPAARRPRPPGARVRSPRVDPCGADRSVRRRRSRGVRTRRARRPAVEADPGQPRDSRPRGGAGGDEAPACRRRRRRRRRDGAGAQARRPRGDAAPVPGSPRCTTRHASGAPGVDRAVRLVVRRRTPGNGGRRAVREIGRSIDPLKPPRGISGPSAVGRRSSLTGRSQTCA